MRTPLKSILHLTAVAACVIAAEKADKNAKTADRAEPAAAVSTDSKNYIIGAEDVLLIRVWREPDLSGPVPVRPDGKISIPLANEVVASGLTPDKLAGNIAQALTKYINHPEVTVSVQQVNSKKYFINGEVLKPGAYPLAVPTRVMEALVNAGGFREFANTKKITVLRGTTRLPFNYKEVSKGKSAEQNIFLEPGDQIIVP